jgi:hypothetical protein
MTRTALEGFGKSDEVVIEATANSMGVSRVLAPFVARVAAPFPSLFWIERFATEAAHERSASPSSRSSRRCASARSVHD